MDQASFLQQILEGVHRTMLPGAVTMREQMVFWFGLCVLLQLVTFGWAVVFDGRKASWIGALLLKSGLLWWLLYNFPDVYDGIVSFFARVGLTIGQNHVSLAEFLDPGQYLRLAWRSAAPLFAAMKAHTGLLTWPGAWVSWFLLWLAYLAAFALMAGHVFIWQIELMVAGVMMIALLPTLAFRATQWVGQAVFAFIMNLALKFGMGALLVGLTFPLMDKLAPPDTATLSLEGAVVMVLGGWMFAALFFTVNRLASGLASGIPQLSGGLLVGAAAGSAAVLGAVVGGGASLGAGAAAGTAGGARLGLGAIGAGRGIATRSAGTGMLSAAHAGAHQMLAGRLAQRLAAVSRASAPLVAGQARRSLRDVADAARYVGHDHGTHGFRH